MIFIYIIIFIVSIADIKTTDLPKDSSLNRIIIIPSCHADKTGLESFPKSTDRHYYFYVSSQSSSALSSSSSHSSLLHLSYCEHQHTTYYSSSGFSILRSSPRLPHTDIVDKNYSSSFHHHHNAILSAVDQSSSPGSNLIATLMSSSSSSSSSLKEKQLLVGKDDNMILTTMNTFAQTTTTAFANLSFGHTTTAQKEHRTLNIMLLIGCIVGGILLLILIYSIIKYYNRDEGSYKIDESKNFALEPSLDKTDNRGCGGKISSSKQQRQKLLTTDEQTLANSKEWYV